MDGPAIRTRRLLVAHLVILAVLGGFAWEIITQREHWPFSNFAMYSGLTQPRTFEDLQLFGVEPGGREVELNVWRRNTWLKPFDAARLTFGLRRLERDPEAMASSLRALGDHYQMLRRRGLSEAPPIDRLRVYRSAWAMDAWAANVDRPLERRLLADVPVKGVDDPPR